MKLFNFKPLIGSGIKAKIIIGLSAAILVTGTVTTILIIKNHNTQNPEISAAAEKSGVVEKSIADTGNSKPVSDENNNTNSSDTNNTKETTSSQKDNSISNTSNNSTGNSSSTSPSQSLNSTSPASTPNKTIGLDTALTDSYNSTYEHPNYSGVKVPIFKSIADRIASGDISHSQADKELANLGIWIEYDRENWINSIVVKSITTTSSDIAYIHKNYDLNISAEPEHYLDYTRTLIYYKGEGKYTVTRVGFNFGRGAIPPPPPPKSPYYVDPPKVNGYNKGLTDMYNSNFGETNKYFGVKASEFSQIIYNVANGTLDYNVARNQIDNMAPWEENGKRWRINGVGVDYMDSPSNDAKVIHDQLESEGTTPPNSPIAFITSDIYYSDTWRENRIYRFVINIVPQE